MTKQAKIQYNGLCTTCSRRRRCPKAQLLLDLSKCGAFKIHHARKVKPAE